MNVNVSLAQTPPLRYQNVEVVERKGKGHPDTICDALAEQLSIALCRFCHERFGIILHHNVDKMLLWGGAAEPRFGGGEVKAPFELFLAGRATREFSGIAVPVEELAIDGSLQWLRNNFHALDADRHVRIHSLLRGGSADLVDLYSRQQRTGIWLANDTSCGVGFAPLTDLERVVYKVENDLNTAEVKSRYPEIGEDIKIMGVRRNNQISLTLACAFIDRFVDNLDDYIHKKQRLKELACKAAREITDMAVAVDVNTGDDESSGNVYLTVTGTSAEAGDDGQVGRGNRANGLITPYRPMTMEAVAGKNPITHVGKLYNVAANRIAETIAEEIPEALEAQCYLVSQIGRPITDPHIVDIRLTVEGKHRASAFSGRLEEIISHHLGGIDQLWRRLVNGEIPLY
jgi:S-adenosylmethionine synthetase